MLDFKYIDKNVIEVPFLTEKECKEGIEYAENKEVQLTKNIDKINPDDLNCNYPDITTQCYDHYNFFRDNPQYIKRLSNVINQIFGSNIEYPLILNSWVNIYKKDKGIGWHIHNAYSHTYVKGYTANIFLGGDENIGLSYAVHDVGVPRYRYKHIKNRVGHMIIMPNDVYHMVRKNPSSEKRYTVGMTINEYHPEFLKNFVNHYGEDLSKDSFNLVLTSPQKQNIVRNTIKY